MSSFEYDAVEIILGIARRIIENKHLKKLNAVHEHVLRSTRDGIWNWDVIENSTHFSDQWKSMLGYEPDELENDFNTWVELLHPQDKEMALTKADNFFAFPRDEYNSTFRMRCKDGGYKWIMARGSVAEWLEKDIPKRIIGTHVDIDHQKYLEKNLVDATRHLQREKELLTRCSAVANIGTWRVDLTNNTIWWSDKTREIHGVDESFEPTIDNAIEFYEQGWSRDLITEKFTRCVEYRESYDEELIIINAQGDKKWVRAVGIMSEDADKKISYGLFQDIDERVQSTLRLEQAKLTAEQANRVKSDFLATMSHEIRTPMNGVLGILQMLSKGDLSDQQSSQLQLALTSADNLLDLINDLLDLSKIEANKIDLENKPFNLSELLSDISQAMAFKAFEKEIDFILDTHGLTVKTVVGDPHRIKQVLTNLLSNAIKFTQRGNVSLIAYNTLTDDGFVSFSCDVIDSGIGICKERVDSIFTPFTQEDSSTTRKYGGTGLGLSISKKLCQLMGGDITVISEQGKGSTFKFCIKLSSSEDSLDLTQIDLSKITVLVVGSSDKEYAATQNMLSQHKANVIYCASLTENAPEADIILIDQSVLINQSQNMSQLFGKEKVSIVVLSNKADLILSEEIQERGIHEILLKPFNMESFYKLRCITNRSPEMLQNRAHESQSDVKSYGSNQSNRILIAEDNFINQQVIEGLLDDYGYELTIVDNGAIALDTLKTASSNAPYHLVIMDCQMPEMDGYTATRCIRDGQAGKQYQSIPIIAMTANAMKGDREKCISAGMSDYLTKPIEIDQLTASLEKYLAH